MLLALTSRGGAEAGAGTRGPPVQQRAQRPGGLLAGDAASALWARPRMSTIATDGEQWEDMEGDFDLYPPSDSEEEARKQRPLGLSAAASAGRKDGVSAATAPQAGKPRKPATSPALATDSELQLPRDASVLSVSAPPGVVAPPPPWAGCKEPHAQSLVGDKMPALPAHGIRDAVVYTVQCNSSTSMPAVPGPAAQGGHVEGGGQEEASEPGPGLGAEAKGEGDVSFSLSASQAAGVLDGVDLSALFEMNESFVQTPAKTATADAAPAAAHHAGAAQDEDSPTDAALARVVSQPARDGRNNNNSNTAAGVAHEAAPCHAMAVDESYDEFDCGSMFDDMVFEEPSFLLARSAEKKKRLAASVVAHTGVGKPGDTSGCQSAQKGRSGPHPSRTPLAPVNRNPTSPLHLNNNTNMGSRRVTGRAAGGASSGAQQPARSGNVAAAVAAPTTTKPVESMPCFDLTLDSDSDHEGEQSIGSNMGAPAPQRAAVSATGGARPAPPPPPPVTTAGAQRAAEQQYRAPSSAHNPQQQRGGGCGGADTQLFKTPAAKTRVARTDQSQNQSQNAPLAAVTAVAASAAAMCATSAGAGVASICSQRAGAALRPPRPGSAGLGESTASVGGPAVSVDESAQHVLVSETPQQQQQQQPAQFVSGSGFSPSPSPIVTVCAGVCAVFLKDPVQV